MIRLAVRVRRGDAELVLAEILELAPAGLEEVDIDADTVEYALYGDAADLPSEHALAAVAGGALLGVQKSSVEDDWADRWREFHKPLVLGDRLAVRPPWEPAQATAVDLVIDPGRAFGTGAHATTRLCLEMLLELELPAQETGADRLRTIDLGCGSGVLAIAAVQLGFGPVLALDYDQLAVDATIENAQVNGVEDSIDVRQFDLTQQPVPAADLVLANLLAPLLTAWADRIPLFGKAFYPGLIIASGMLATEADAVGAAFARVGYAEQARSELGEWAASALRRVDSL